MTNDPRPSRQTDGWLEPGKTNIQVIYVLYLVGFIIGISAVVGIVLAYLNRGKSEPWVETHYTWAIRTFWIAVLGAIVSMLLMVIGIGFLLMIALAVWVIVRCVVGLQRAGRNEAIRDPYSWLI